MKKLLKTASTLSFAGMIFFSSIALVKAVTPEDKLQKIILVESKVVPETKTTPENRNKNLFTKSGEEESTLSYTNNSDEKIVTNTLKNGKIDIITKNIKDINNFEIKMPLNEKILSVEYVDKNGSYILSGAFNTPKNDLAMMIINTKNSHIQIGFGLVYKEISGGIVQKQNSEYNVYMQDNQTVNIKVKLRNEENTKKENVKNPAIISDLNTPSPYKYTYWVIETPNSPYENKDFLKTFSKLINNNEHYILPDGYYYKMNSDSSPYGEGYYFRHPSLYIVSPLLNSRENICSQILLNTLLKLADKNINEYGYMPIPYVSKWLQRDYSMPKDYYDTRWNMDLAYLSYRSYDIYKDKFYLNMGNKLMDYYHKYADINKIEFIDANGNTGILVEDYAIGLEKKMTHSSLNHHLMGIKTVYYANKFNNDKRNMQLIDKMIKGVEMTEEKWKKENGDLHYAYIKNDEYGMKDYPTLTLNDLKDVNYMYKNMHGAGNKSLENLIKAKEDYLKKTNYQM